MRKFIISDLHGCGEVYDSIMAYLEMISLIEPVELTMNGDLIDWGLDSFRMLQDVKKRMIETSSVKINYLGGNHELMMYDALHQRKPERKINPFSEWIRNGGMILKEEIESQENSEELCAEFKSFLGNLNVYRTYTEKIGGKPIVLVHAQAPRVVHPACQRKIKEDDMNVYFMVSRRQGDGYGLRHVGNPDYFTIIGHTPNLKEPGFSYDKRENCLNIDGGCSAYAKGFFEVQLVPLVEVKKDHLELLLFNHNNQIVSGYYYFSEFEKMNEEDLNQRKIYLNPIFNGVENEKKKLIQERMKKR